MAASSVSTQAQPLDRVSNALRAVSNQLIFCVIDLESHIDLTTLSAALRSIYAKLPLARSSFVEKQFGAAWIKQGLAELEVIAASNLTAELSAAEATPCSCAMRVKVLRNDKCDTLLMVVDHRFADATGTRHLAYTLAHSYNHLLGSDEKEPLHAPMNHATEHEPVANISWRRRLSALLRLKLASDQLRLPLASHLDQVSSAYSIRRVDMGNLSALKEDLRAYGATVNDLLLACVAQALRRECRAVKATRFSLLFTVDLRRYLKSARSAFIGNLSGSEQISLGCNTSNADKNLDAIGRQTHSIKTSDPGLGAFVLADLLFLQRILPVQSILQSLIRRGASSGRFVPVMTNLGQLDESSLTFGSAKTRTASLIGPNLTIAGLTIFASVYQHSLTLGLGYNRNRVSTALVDRLLDSIEAELGTAVKA